MSKKALLMLPISLMVISTASCSWLFKKTKEEIIKEQNPGYIIEKVTTYSSFYYKNDEYDCPLADDDNTILNKLRNVDEFTYVKKQPDLSDDYFVYYAKTPGFMGYYTKEITIYENGYASTMYRSSQSEYHGTYYYQFDEDIAESLLKEVKNKYKAVVDEIKREQEERDRTEREYNQMIEDMDMYSIIGMMEKEEVLDIKFHFVTDEEEPRYYTFTFKDDGTIVAALKNATYDMRASQSGYGVATIFIDGTNWSFRLDKSTQVAEANYQTKDKYYRDYSKKIINTVDMESIDYIMNRAFELSAPKNPFANSSSNPSSSSEQ